MSSIAGNTTTTAVLSPDDIEIHSIDAAGDQDWFAVSLVAGMNYSFTVSSAGGPGIGLVGPDLGLYTGLGAPLQSQSSFSGASSTITFRALTSGTYYLGVGDSGGNTGRYALGWVHGDTIRADVATASSLVANGRVAGALEVAADADWFALSMTAGLSYGFVLSGATTDPLRGSDLYLRDGTGNELTRSVTYSPTTNSIAWTATTTGAYFLSVSDGDNATGGYTIDWITTDTIRNNISTTQTLGRNASVSSTIDVRGDADWFKVTMNAGETYGFQVLADSTNPLQWGDLQLRDAQGNILASFISYSGAPNTLAYTPGSTGTYFVTVHDTDGDTGGYILYNLGADSVRANVTTASRLVDGGQLRGTIEMLSDSDWHRIEAQQGQSYTFTLSGDGTGAELTNTRLFLRDAAGNDLREVWGPHTTITHLATATGPLYLDVRGFNNDHTGGYVLSVVSDVPSLVGTSRADRLQGGAGDTAMNGAGGKDWLDGGAGNDRLFGGTGADRLFGNADDDRLYGGIGNDRLSGGSGRDMLDGGAGADLLTGGAGADQFVLRPGSGVDTITDFQDGTDQIRFVGGPASFAGLTLTTQGDHVRVSFGDVAVVVQNITTAELTAADFLFG